MTWRRLTVAAVLSAAAQFPGSGSAAPAPAAGAPPAPPSAGATARAAAKASGAEIEIEAPGPRGPLRAGLIRPASPSAGLVLILPGSGPTDRDGNSPLGIRASTYRLLAEGLAARGIGSVRVDKRGLFGSQSAIADANDVTLGDYADDVQSWIETIKAQVGPDCISVLGHSEGGLVALLAAGRVKGICRLILVAAPGRRLGAILAEQLKANPANAPFLDQALAAITTLEQGQPVDASTLDPILWPLFRPAIQPFLIDAFALDPAALIARVGQPVLIVQGLADLQVKSDDAERLAAAAPGSRLVLLPEVNHVLKRVPADDRARNLASYADPALPVAPAVIDAIAAFLGGAAGERLSAPVRPR